jgi:hypothetical protein
MWIQVERDPTKEWLQMRYYVTVEELQWAMKDWKDEWQVPLEQPKDKQIAKDKQPKKDKQSREVGSSQRKSTRSTNKISIAGCTKLIWRAQKQRKILSPRRAHSRRTVQNLLME